jgi:hypothetical protein
MKKKEKPETPQKLKKISLKRETILGLALSDMGQTSSVYPTTHTNAAC